VQHFVDPMHGLVIPSGLRYTLCNPRVPWSAPLATHKGQVAAGRSLGRGRGLGLFEDQDSSDRRDHGG
jgi:hypothetical protein